MRVHPQGWPWVGGALALALASYAARRFRTGTAALVAAAAFAYFFRDPERYTHVDCRTYVLAPADGVVVTLRQEPEPRWLQDERAWRIGIFMRVTDVHVNRMPLAARVVRIEHQPGRFLPAYREESLRQNERRLYYLEGEQGRKALLVQVAGILARRTVPLVQPGQVLACGQRFGLIRFGSRVELYLPGTVQPLVEPGQEVRAGETPLARWPTP